VTTTENTELAGWPSTATNFVRRKKAQKAQKKRKQQVYKINHLPVVVLRLLRLFAAIQTI
jgi:hypothetical protein